METASVHFLVASDIHRDGLGLEMWDDAGQIAEIFRCDNPNSLTFRCFREDVPFVYIEKMVSLARLRLGEFEDCEQLPSPLE